MIKKLLYFILVMLVFSACSADETEDTVITEIVYASEGVDVVDVLMGEHLRILDIGNSYSVDATTMLNGIVKAANIDTKGICYYRLFCESAGFSTWYDEITGIQSKSVECAKVVGDYPVEVPVGKFNDCSVMRKILEQEWDLILLHPSSADATDFNLWNKSGKRGNLYSLITCLKELQPHAAFGFIMIHSYAGYYVNNKEKSTRARWEHIVSTSIPLQYQYPVFQLIIPYGTAIENLRNSSLNNEYELTRDGTHLGIGLPQYAAACCMYQSLFSKRSGVDVMYNTYRYICSQNERKKYAMSFIDVTDATSIVAQHAAMWAVNDMMNIHNPE